MSACRHPIADHYSLTLEIAKDRATEASPVLCTPQMYSLGQCPADVLVNERFVRRSLNEPCREMVGHPPPSHFPSLSKIIRLLHYLLYYQFLHVFYCIVVLLVITLLSERNNQHISQVDQIDQSNVC